MSYSNTGERTWIDEAADRFESDWKQGGDRPRIEDFLAQEAGPRRPLLLQELLRVERELRKTAGETPGPQEYRQRFPDDRAAVDAVFGHDAHVDPPAKPRGTPPRACCSACWHSRTTSSIATPSWPPSTPGSPISPSPWARSSLTAARSARHDMPYCQPWSTSISCSTASTPSAAWPSSLSSPRFATASRTSPTSTSRPASSISASPTPTARRRRDSTASWDEDNAATDAEGRFRIVRFHDRGALGEVFIARDQQLHRIVALKRIKLDHATDKDKRARFVVEAEITGRLEHPGIVPVYGLGTYDDGRPFYAMRFIRGDNLKAAIEQFHKAEDKGRDPGERTLALLKLLRRFLDVCNAIDYAHSRGVLHRDLKPGNIMLGKFGETLVVDWGLAKSVGRPEAAPASATMDDRTLVPQSGSDLRGTELGARLGTPAYMSPEQAAGRIADLGPASDVYSLARPSTAC